MEALLIGAAIADVMVRPVDETVFRTGSVGVDGIRMGTGGSALNAATILSRLGHSARLVTKLGQDDTAAFIARHCAREGIDLFAAYDPEIDTGINVVLVDPNGERYFITNRSGSLRRLSLPDILPAFDSPEFASVRAVCLSSLFVSPMLPLNDAEELFAKAKHAGKLVCADTTTRKNGETLADAAKALGHLDYFFPNLREALLLTGPMSPEDAARALLGTGMGCAVIKMGADGCLAADQDGVFRVPACPGTRCVDTTGAGDAFTAGFMAALLEGRSNLECAARANAAASIVVESLGACTAPLSKEETERRARLILAQTNQN